MTETTIYYKKLKIGYTISPNDKSNVYLELEVKQKDDSQTETFRRDNDGNKYDIGHGIEHETIDHHKLSSYKTISLCGSSKHFVGQIGDDLFNHAIQFTIDKKIVRRIQKLWNQWHLNDLQPNCIHQEAFNCNDRFDEQAARETKKCPHHYAYGSKWLVKIVPQDVIDELTILFSTAVQQ